MGPDVQILRRWGRAIVPVLFALGGSGRDGAARQEPAVPGEQAPRAALHAVAPAFALRDLEGSRRRSERLFGEASVLVFTDGPLGNSDAIVELLVALRERLPCQALALVVVDMSPRWVTSGQLARVYSRIDGAVVLRDPDRELAPAYLPETPPLVYVLDRRTEVRFLGSASAFRAAAAFPGLPPSICR